MEEFYKKKVIRDFLALFSESKWKNLCVLCIEYCILILKKNYQVSSLSMDDIEQFVDDLIQEDAKKTKKNLKKFDIGHKQQSDTSITSNANSRPSSNWRKGDTKTIFDGNDNETDNGINNKQQQQHQLREHYSKQSGNSSYYEDTDMSIISRKTKEKAIDDILYPKQKVAMTYKNDYVFNSGNKKYNHKSDYTTTYSNNYNSNKLKKKESTYHRNNYHRNNSNRNDYSFSKQLSTSNSNSNMKFNSGLQMLKMRTPSTYKHAYTRSNSTKRNNTVNNITNIYESKYKNISSKIKNQIETDKKIYEMMKNKKRDDRKTFEDRESSITYRKSEMSFEEGFSSLV